MNKSACILAVAAPMLLCSLAQADPITYATSLSGAAEAPPNASPGTGSASVVFDLAAHSLSVSFSFSGLLGTTTAAHIHAATAVPGAGTAGVATQVPRFVGFPTGVTSGSYSHVFDTSLASSWNPAYVTANGGIAGAETAFASALAQGKAYLNIHTTVVPAGEIRGFLERVPDATATAPLLLCGVATLFGLARRVRD